MKEYKDLFQDYLLDLGKKTPNPGGGSCAALGFCLGISLLQMALNYSLPDPAEETEKLQQLADEVYPVIDEDGRIFAALVKEKDVQARKVLIDKAQEMVLRLGENCYQALQTARKIEKNIKKSLASDFYLGLKFIETALFASIQNLNSNQLMFKLDNRELIGRLEKYRQEFGLCLK